MDTGEPRRVHSRVEDQQLHGWRCHRDEARIIIIIIILLMRRLYSDAIAKNAAGPLYKLSRTVSCLHM